ncbi:Response regulator receiver domain-containing protein [Marinitoga hydrogenitolerans DSM 16785]|uniref:Response regulator receiver domain-containing protein n=1 Tax=Marinitoga hydrogenitolerans (strain DSM 16785 / JCM 12826 / AT1271) TaxID=1122195 RepID=A0A1M4TEC8_MARH1|nr:SpoIIE family protein phosphatase [Marinitoga hydrogenitolerans]SHE42714.1 Response regulator receiver domain-containing protein [Marinitoga hydrogenitolerans DSM 16785]
MVKILIIDENEDHRFFIKYIFSNENKVLKDLEFDEKFKIYEARDGIEGVKMAQLYEPNIVILEENLQEIDGIVVCEKIKALKPDTPIIFLTTVNVLEIKEKAFQVGASDYIIKPAHPYEIIMRIKKHLDFYNAQKKLKKTLESYEKDLKIARNVQKNLLPKIKKINNVMFDYIYISSHNTSGDMIGVVPIGDNRVFAYEYDISGHGVTSALLSIIVRQEIEQIVQGNEIIDLKEIILKLEENTKEYFFDGMYFTGIFSIISKDKIEYANLAHREIIFLKKDKKIEYDSRTEFPMGVGLIDRNNLNIYNKTIDKDSFIIYYTDGILEIDNFSEKRLYEFLTSKKYNHPQEIINDFKKKFETLLDFNFPDDDITVLVLKQEE